MSRITINTPEELLKYLRTSESTTALQTARFGDGFALHFKIVGDDWTGDVDYRVGRFVQDLQRDILGIYNEATGEKLSLRSKHDDIKKLLVTVEVRNGSLDILAKLDKVMETMIHGMTGQQIAITTVALGVLVVGGYVFKKHNERKEKLDALKINTKNNNADREIIKKALDVVSSNNTAFTHLLSRAGKEDSLFVKVDGRSEEIPVAEARENLPKTLVEIPEKRSIQTWGHFKLNTLDARSYTFTLETEGLPTIRALTSFATPEESGAFSRKYADYMSRSETPEMLLQLSISINTRVKSIEDAFILKVLDAEPENVTQIQKISL